MTPYYQDDSCTIYHGNCREIDAWLSADVLVTDPPYGIDWSVGSMHSERSIWSAATPSIVGDHDTSIRDAVINAWGDRPSVIFGSWRKPRPTQTTHRLIWHKAGRHPGVAPGAIYPNDEEIYLVGSGWVKGRAPMATVITTHEQRAAQPKAIGHPTPKPVNLMVTLIQLCPPGVLADPFMGSGTTLVAASNLGRKAIGVEIEERYCEITARRLAQGTLDFGGAA
jgi:site-specific DNA-methyltransferase (adenine-specific)